MRGNQVTSVHEQGWGCSKVVTSGWFWGWNMFHKNSDYW
jgi:hypothetical protein